MSARRGTEPAAEEGALAHVHPCVMHLLSSSPVLSFGGQSEIAAGVPGHMDEGAGLGSLSGICSGRNPLHSRPG